jgi:hypothetical protein
LFRIFAEFHRLALSFWGYLDLAFIKLKLKLSNGRLKKCLVRFIKETVIRCNSDLCLVTNLFYVQARANDVKAPNTKLISLLILRKKY